MSGRGGGAGYRKQGEERGGGWGGSASGIVLPGEFVEGRGKMDRNSEYSNMDHLGSPEGVDCTFLLIRSLLHSPQHSLLHIHSSCNSIFLTLTSSFILYCMYNRATTHCNTFTHHTHVTSITHTDSLIVVIPCTFTISNTFTHPMPIFSKSSHSLALNYLLHPH